MMMLYIGDVPPNLIVDMNCVRLIFYSLVHIFLVFFLSDGFIILNDASSNNKKLITQVFFLKSKPKFDPISNT